MDHTETTRFDLPEQRQVCQHRIWNLTPARNEWGEPQLWCRCGHVMECPPARLYAEGGKIETGGNLKLWNNLSAQFLAKHILAGRR